MSVRVPLLIHPSYPVPSTESGCHITLSRAQTPQEAHLNPRTPVRNETKPLRDGRDTAKGRGGTTGTLPFEALPRWTVRLYSLEDRSQAVRLSTLPVYFVGPA